MSKYIVFRKYFKYCFHFQASNLHLIWYTFIKSIEQTKLFGRSETHLPMICYINVFHHNFYVCHDKPFKLNVNNTAHKKKLNKLNGRYSITWIHVDSFKCNIIIGFTTVACQQAVLLVLLYWKLLSIASFCWPDDNTSPCNVCIKYPDVIGFTSGPFIP